MKLSKKQLKSYNTNGYIILRGFLPKSKCNKILKVAKYHLKNKIQPIESEVDYHSKTKNDRMHLLNYNTITNQTPRRLRKAYSRDKVFKKWMKNTKIRPIVKQILKDTPTLILAHHNCIMTKMPKTSTKTMWHQDIRYWSYQNDNLISVWLALGKENTKNGSLSFIPKSHNMQFSKKCFDSKDYFDSKYHKNKELIKTKISSKLKKGDVVIFHCKLLHCAGKNKTQKAKISFVYTLKGKKTKALKNTRSDKFREIVLK